MAHNILIVDDSATTRAVIKRAVQLSGAANGGSVLEAENGKRGLEVLAASDNAGAPAVAVSLVLADLHMPEMGGVEMTQRMLAHPRLNRIPVIVVSAEPDTNKLEELKRQGVRGYIRKPFTPEALRKIITDTLGAAHAA